MHCLFIEQAYGSQASVSSLAPSLYLFTLIAGRMLVHRVEHNLGFVRLLQVGAIGTMVLLIGLTYSRSLYLSLAAFACMGQLMAPFVPGLYAWISKNTEERYRVRALSGVTALSYLGYLLSPLIFWWYIELWLPIPRLVCHGPCVGTVVVRRPAGERPFVAPTESLSLGVSK